MSDTLDGVFYMSLATLFFGSVAMIVRMCYKSKCNEITCCGCIKILRDVDIEKEEDLLQPPSPKQNNV
jgi:hypothetical protein